MGVISEFIEKRYSLADIGREISQSWRNYDSATGIKVTEETALQTTAVYACVTLIAQTLAELPLQVFKRIPPRGKELAVDYHLYSLLHDNPNPEMPSFQMRETMQGHILLRGNAYAEIDWDERTGQARGIWPLRPDRMRLFRDKGKLYYIYTTSDGQEHILPSYRVWHIPGFGYDGLMGYTPIKLSREAIGLSRATEEFGARFFGQGTHVGGIIQYPGKLKDEGLKRYKESVNEAYSGLGKSHRLLLLEEGMQWQKVGIDPDDAQFLETRKFQLNEICRFYRVPPHLVSDTAPTTSWGTGIEQQNIGFLQYTIQPWLTRWEQWAHMKLMGPEDRKKYFVEFLVQGLLRGDAKSRSEYYNQRFMIGSMSPNDIRAKENENPIDGGDKYYIPLNMVEAGEADIIQPISGQNSFRGNQLFEIRSKRLSLLRARTAKSYERVFRDAAARVVKRETLDIKKAARKYLGERTAGEFNAWLNEFYATFPEYIQRQIRPAAEGLMEAIGPLAAEEVNGEPDKEKLEKFVDDYMTAFDKRYTDSSKGQLQAVVEENRESQEEALAAVETRLGEWEERRPGKVAMNETVQLSNAVAKIVFAGAGVTKLVWNAIGSDSCPFCQEMDGKVVGIDKPFVGADDVLEAEGKSDMKVYRPTTHAPLHEGCVCQVSPG